MNYSLSEFDYQLPEHLIAHEPSEKRDKSKLIKFEINNNTISDHTFDEIPSLLPNNSVLVFNNTKVINARVICSRNSGAKIECFFLKKIKAKYWEVMLKNAQRVKIGEKLGVSANQNIEVIEKKGKNAIVKILSHLDDFLFLEKFGNTPLPPYIKTNNANNYKNRYQSIFAKEPGAVAAPTASLHFTEEVCAQLKEKNIDILYITLHIGLGTFNPIINDNITDHKMHKEIYKINNETANKLNQAKANAKPIIAVGTTVARCLESNIKDSRFSNEECETDLYIYPGYSFNAIDGIITNFHLPKSSLFILIASLVGLENLLKVYNHAIKKEYKFFSFGDAMLIT